MCVCIYVSGNGRERETELEADTQSTHSDSVTGVKNHIIYLSSFPFIPADWAINVNNWQPSLSFHHQKHKKPDHTKALSLIFHSPHSTYSKQCTPASNPFRGQASKTSENPGTIQLLYRCVATPAKHRGSRGCRNC